MPSRDVFISHASEDKNAVAQPLASLLQARGWTVWFDEFELQLGDSLRRRIDEGLASARFGLVILSPNFFEKEWPQRELDGLTAREIGGAGKIILPIWHGVDHEVVATFSPPLADKLAVTTDGGLDQVVDQIERVLRAPARAEARNAGSEGRPVSHARERPPSDPGPDGWVITLSTGHQVRSVFDLQGRVEIEGFAIVPERDPQPDEYQVIIEVRNPTEREQNFDVTILLRDERGATVGFEDTYVSDVPSGARGIGRTWATITEAVAEIDVTIRAA